MIRTYTYFISLLILLSSCSSAKKAEKSNASGDYDTAFNIAITKLNKDKYKKSNQKVIPALKTAFTKANQRDQEKIKQLKKVEHLDNLKQVYALYVEMDVRQDEVLALLPLSYENKEVHFKTKDYAKNIKSSLDKYSKSLYTTASTKLAGSKIDARSAYEYFNDLEFVNPNYVSNLSDLIVQAKKKGSSIVLIKLNNKIAQQTTQEQLDELIRISESNMSNKWVMYHKTRENNTIYDYEAVISLDKMLVTPEQVNSKTYPQQARVKDGWEYIYDSNGNIAKDSLGNNLKRAKIITVKAEVKLFQQVKSGKVDGSISIKNLKTNTLMSNTALFGEAKLENVFGKFRGDQRAIEQKYHKALQNKEAKFPADQEFVKYSLADFRNKMLQVLDQQAF